VANELPEKFDQIVQSWDTANKAGELAPTLTLPRMRRREGRGRTSWGIRGKTFTCCTYCASAWSIPNRSGRRASNAKLLRLMSC
jgi:hypothetical protein